MKPTAAVAVLATIAATPLLGASSPEPAGSAAFRIVADEAWCKDAGHHHDQATWCEVREAILPAPTGVLSVDAAPNGGVAASGAQRRDIRLRVMVVARAATESDARALAAEVKVETGRAIHAVGPAQHGNAGWWASFDAEVPRRSDLELASVNGPVSLSGVEGHASLRTENGPLTLRGAAGSVKGRTTNGPVSVRLSGTSWSGEGLDVETVNGPVAVSVPAGYNARLEAGTVNGPIDLGFPVTVQGSLKHDVTTTLGSGGPLVRARTTNGPLSLRRP